MPWFVKHETFRRPRAEVSGPLRAHRHWVQGLQEQGRSISSGFLVDGEGRPGGGGLLIFEASSYADAEALVREDPMIAGGCVDWRLHEWRPALAGGGGLSAGAVPSDDGPLRRGSCSA